MHTILNRANALLALAISVSVLVLGITSAVTPIMSIVDPVKLPTPKFNMKSLTVGKENSYYGARQVARFKFDLDADLSPLYAWNTKQLFVYVVAEYKTKTHHVNQVTLWDDRITTKEKCHIKLKNKMVEYPFTHFTGTVSGLQANITLHWNIIPSVGLFLNDKASVPIGTMKVPTV